MSRYIDVDALKLDIDLSKGATVLDMAINVIKMVQEAPTADVVEKKRGKWRRMYRQYQCSSCGAVIDERQDNGLYGMINFGERKPYCYWCGSCNDFERSENGT